MNIQIYSKSNCIFCDKAKITLQKYDPEIKMLEKDYTMDDFFKKFPSAKTFPQIIINSEHIGGYTELKKWLEQNSFDNNF
jgi:glutaredoxin 3